MTVHTEYSVILYRCVSFLDDDVLEVETCRRVVRDKVLFITDLQFVGLRIDHEKVATLFSQYSQPVQSASQLVQSISQ